MKFLKTKTSCDPHGYTHDLINDDVAGEDLNIVILKMMNPIKSEQIYPKALEDVDISINYNKEVY